MVHTIGELFIYFEFHHVFVQRFCTNLLRGNYFSLSAMTMPLPWIQDTYLGKIVIVGENVLGGKYWAGGVKFSRNLKKRKHFLKKEEIRKMESRNGERE